jgi:hypothetical protein
MKISIPNILFLAYSCLFTAVLRTNASDAIAGAPLVAGDANQIEVNLLAGVRAAALCNAFSPDDLSARLMAASSSSTSIASSVLLSRRTMAVCSLLQSDNEHGRAMKLAQSALNRLANMTEQNDSDREERLYWQALLEGRVLDQKAVAVAHLEAARKIAPDDERVLVFEQEMAAALLAFDK